jgi:hypothetical protein
MTAEQKVPRKKYLRNTCFFSSPYLPFAAQDFVFQFFDVAEVTIINKMI